MLNTEQIQKIRQQLFESGLTNPSMLNELTDHFSSGIEFLMQDGHNFDASFKQTFENIPKDFFRNIETKSEKLSLSRLILYNRLMISSIVVIAVFLSLAIIGFIVIPEVAWIPALAGLAIFLLIYSPVSIARRMYLDEKEKIMRSLSISHPDNSKTKELTNNKRSAKPITYGNRRMGLTWGGGNIHASNASRGTRRNFLRK